MKTTVLTSVLVAMLLGAHAQAEDAKQAEANYAQINLGFKSADEDRVAPLLEQLGSHDFFKREAASKKLREIGPAAFSLLSHHYRECNDFEVRLRIRGIVKDQYLWHTLLKHKGFMGISYGSHTGRPLKKGVSAITVNTVQRSSAAHDAGVAPGDLIVTINGKSTGDLIEQEAFAVLVQNKGAGGKIVLGILRRKRVRDVTLHLKARPIKDYTSPELLDELNSRMQAYSIWWEDHFSLPRVSRERAPSAEVLQIPKN